MLTITPKELTRAIVLCKQVTERRNTIPVLGYLRLTASGNILTVQATDLDNLLSVQAECECAEGLDVLLKPDILAHFARHAQAPITIKRDGETVKLESGDLRAEFFDLIPVQEFPAMRAPDGASVTIAEAEFCDLLHHTRPCISTEKTRYYLNGVYLHAPKGRLVACATDGHRLTEYSADAEWLVKPHILPTKAAKIVALASKKGNGALAVTSDNDVNRCALRFDAQGWSLICKTIDGTFPDYTRAMPKMDKPTIKATVSRAAAMALPKARGFYNRVGVKIDPTAGTITTDCKPDGYAVTVPCAGEGEAFGVNAAYLQGFMARHDVLRFEGDSKHNPFWLRSDNPKLRMVIMPMRVG